MSLKDSITKAIKNATNKVAKITKEMMEEEPVKKIHIRKNFQSCEQTITINGEYVFKTNSDECISIVVEGNVDTIDTQGSVEVKGDVSGDISTQGSVECGNVGGDIQTQGSVRCQDVGRGVHTQGRVECNNILSGGIETMGGVDVQGSVSGDIDTMGSVTVHNK